MGSTPANGGEKKRSDGRDTIDEKKGELWRPGKERLPAAQKFGHLRLEGYKGGKGKERLYTNQKRTDEKGLRTDSTKILDTCPRGRKSGVA